MPATAKMPATKSMCDKTHSWLLCMWDMTHSWLNDIWNMADSWIICMWDMSHSWCIYIFDMTHSRLHYGFDTTQFWLIHVCDVTYSRLPLMEENILETFEYLDLCGFPGLFWVTGTPFTHVKTILKFGDSRENVFDMYGDSREGLLEILAVVIISSPISSVRGLICVTWLICDFFLRETWLIMEWFICVTWLVHIHEHDMTRPYSWTWHDSSIFMNS